MLRGKYWRLGLGELAAVASFIFAAVTLVLRLEGSARLALWSSLVPLLAVLVQAGIYWLMARKWVELGPMPRGVAIVYRILRVANVFFLGAGLIGLVAWRPDSALLTALIVAVWAFGVVEYVNYFHVRLSYPAGVWFQKVGQRRTPQLVKDLRTAAP